MYTILISDTARKQLRKLEKPIQERIFLALEKIRIRPESFVIRLVGATSYKLRVSDYRIILDINNNELRILVITIGHRKNVYG